MNQNLMYSFVYLIFLMFFPMFYCSPLTKSRADFIDDGLRGTVSNTNFLSLSDENGTIDIPVRYIRHISRVDDGAKVKTKRSSQNEEDGEEDVLEPERPLNSEEETNGTILKSVYSTVEKAMRNKFYENLMNEANGDGNLSNDDGQSSSDDVTSSNGDGENLISLPNQTDSYYNASTLLQSFIPGTIYYIKRNSRNSTYLDKKPSKVDSTFYNATTLLLSYLPGSEFYRGEKRSNKTDYGGEESIDVRSRKVDTKVSESDLDNYYRRIFQLLNESWRRRETSGDNDYYKTSVDQEVETPGDDDYYKTSVDQVVETSTVYGTTDEFQTKIEDATTEAYDVDSNGSDGAPGNDTKHVEVAKQLFPWRDSFIMGCLYVSIPFLAATLAIYWIIPHLNQSDHGKSTICYLLSLTTGYTCLAVTLSFGDSLGPMCSILGYLMHFCFISISTWLNVMCFDILWAFSVLEKNECRPPRFRRYSVYAWGMPTVIVLVTFGLRYAPLPDYIRPLISAPLCFYPNQLTQFIYCHGTVVILTGANVIMFIATGITIWNHTRKTDILSSDSARARVQKRWFRVYSKLFFVSGMNWAFEHLSMIVDYDNNSVLFFCTDTMNALLGVVVFLILICHKRVLNSLHRWWTGEDRLTGKKRSTMASTLTRFRQGLIQSKFGSKLFSH